MILHHFALGLHFKVCILNKKGLIFFFSKKGKYIKKKPTKTVYLTGAAPAQASEEREFLLQRALCLIDVGVWSKAEYANFQSRLLIHLTMQTTAFHITNLMLKGLIFP